MFNRSSEISGWTSDIKISVFKNREKNQMQYTIEGVKSYRKSKDEAGNLEVWVRILIGIGSGTEEDDGNWKI